MAARPPRLTLVDTELCEPFTILTEATTTTNYSKCAGERSFVSNIKERVQVYLCRDHTTAGSATWDVSNRQLNVMEQGVAVNSITNSDCNLSATMAKLRNDRKGFQKPLVQPL